jgi:hypothetical protein
MITLFQIFGKNSPFYQEELPKLPPILGSLWQPIYTLPIILMIIYMLCLNVEILEY